MSTRTHPRTFPAFVALLAVVALIGCAGSAPSGSTAPSSGEAAAAESSTVPEGINDRFLSDELDPQDFVERWEVESREIYAERAEIVEAIGLRPGEAIADIGSGTGLFVAPFSETVGSRGDVYAVDISPRFIEHLRTRVEDEGLDNVTVVHSREDSATLPDGSIDVAYVCDTYHHFSDQDAMLGSIHSALRPGGRLVVVDFERIPGVSRDWILGHVRAGKETFRSEIEANGFRFVEEVEIPGLEENYFLRFERP